MSKYAKYFLHKYNMECVRKESRLNSNSYDRLYCRRMPTTKCFGQITTYTFIPHQAFATPTSTQSSLRRASLAFLIHLLLNGIEKDWPTLSYTVGGGLAVLLNTLLYFRICVYILHIQFVGHIYID